MRAQVSLEYYGIEHASFFSELRGLGKAETVVPSHRVLENLELIRNAVVYRLKNWLALWALESKGRVRTQSLRSMSIN